eukprot:2143759-Amphidinium_carterae.1
MDARVTSQCHPYHCATLVLKPSSHSSHSLSSVCLTVAVGCWVWYHVGASAVTGVLQLHWYYHSLDVLIRTYPKLLREEHIVTCYIFPMYAVTKYHVTYSSHASIDASLSSSSLPA